MGSICRLALNAACYSGHRAASQASQMIPHGTQDSVRDGRPRPASCMGHRSTHRALDTARDPSCDPGCHMTSRVPRIAHSVHLMSPYEIPPPYGIPHQTHHPARDPGHLSPHTAIEPMITCGMSGPGFNLEWGPVSRTTSDLPHGVSHGTPDPVRDHGSRIQSPMEPRIPGKIPHRIPHWVAVRPRPKGTCPRGPDRLRDPGPACDPRSRTGARIVH